MNSKKLSALIELSSSVKIFVPSTIDINTTVDSSKIADSVLSQLSTMFGGATRYEALGCWVSPSSGLVKEKVTICQSFCTEAQLQQYIDDVVEIAESIKIEMRQDAVAIEVNNKLYFA